MKNIEDVLVIIQARVSSSRCVHKMIRPFADSSLIEIAIRKIQKSKVIPQKNFYLSAYDPELIEIGKKCGVNLFYRSKESAMWQSGADVYNLFDWWNKLPFKYVVFINPCSPLLKIETIDSFFEAYLKSDNDGMFGVIGKRNYFWDEEGNLLVDWKSSKGSMNTSLAPKTLEAAHCLYAANMEKIGKGIWMGDFLKKGDIELYELPENETFDIDYEWQFKMYETLYQHFALNNNL